MTRRRGQLIPKGPDTWLVRVHLGRRKYVSETVKGSRRDAEQALTRKLHQLDTRALTIAPEKLTLDAYLDRWLAQKEPQVVPRTFQSYRDLLRLHVRPRLGAFRLDRISPLLLQDHVTTLSASLSPRMVQYTMTVLGQALRQAVQWGFLPKNPAEHLRMPRLERQEKPILSPQETRTFLQGAVDSPWHPLWTLLLTTGLRPSEALALQWGDIGPDGCLHVTRALRQVSPGKYEAADMKTKGSRRRLWVPQPVLDVLAAHRKAQQRLSPWVFCNQQGHPWDLGKVRKAWYRDLKAVGVPTVPLYAARHSHLSHLVMATGSLKVAQERAGHSTQRITADHYVHLLDEDRKGTADVVQRVIFG